MRSAVVVVASVLALAACAGEAAGPSSQERAGSDTSAGQGPILLASSSSGVAHVSGGVSIFLDVPSGTAVSRLAEVLDSGAVVAGATSDRRRIAAVVPRSEIHRLSSLHWAGAIRVDSTHDVPATDVVPWGVAQLGADQVQATIGNRGTGVRVGIMDTGVDCTNPDLTSRMAGGYDFVASSSSFCLNALHGTGVAGIVAASSNGSGVVGVAPEADLYSLRVCDNAYCYSALEVLALDWAITHQLQVINMSFAGCGDDVAPDLASEIASAYNAGILLVAAAGNGTSEGCANGAPVSGLARLPQTIAVAALYRDGTGSITSPAGYQYGPEVDFAAPANVLTDSVGNTTQVFGGTSGATPHVTGVIALLIKQGYSGYAAIMARLKAGATHVPAGGHDNSVGYGWVNAYGALVNGIPAPGLPVISAAAPITTAGSHTATAVVSGGVASVSFRWSVSYSNNPSLNYTTAYQGAALTFNAPAGSYNIRLTVTPRDAIGRLGSPSNADVPVCTDGGGGGLGPLHVAVGPNAKQGC